VTFLRVLAPVVVDYFAVPGAALRDPTGYAGFWAAQQPVVDRLLVRLAAEVPAAEVVTAPVTAPDGGPSRPPPRIVLEHTEPTSSLNLYRTISDHAVNRPVHVLTGMLMPEHLPGNFDLGRGVSVTEIAFRLYDHGLMLLEVLADIGPWLSKIDVDQVGEQLDALQARVVAMGERAARDTHRCYLVPVLAALRQADRDERVLLTATPDAGPATTELGEALWVTRSLVVNPVDQIRERAVRHWIKDVAIADDSIPPAERLLDPVDPTNHLIRWLNYCFVDRGEGSGRMAPGDPFHDPWDALRYAQVYYGTLDRIDARLSKILADSVASPSRWELDQLNDRLVDQSRRAELIIMAQRDLRKYLKRSVRNEMAAILAFWDTEEVLEGPVRFKIEVCGRRLGELAARRTARSALFTDLILLGIAVTSILGTAVAVTQFGREISSDPAMAVYDLGGSSIVEWVASQPADAILITSALASVVLVVLYLFFRGDRHP
jgi:hypothetical protein